MASVLCALRAGAQEKDPPSDGRPAEPTHNEVDLALDWLARHQSEDGSWDSDSFDARCNGESGGCGGEGGAGHDVGVTALAILAFTGVGETHKSGVHKETVKRALHFLWQAQADDGSFGPRIDDKWIYGHVLATQAFLEAYGLTGSNLFKDKSKSAVSRLIALQQPSGGWGYSLQSPPDVSLTAEAVLALRLASMATLPASDGSLASAMKWLDGASDPESGVAGYRKRGDSSMRYGDGAVAFPASMSAAGAALPSAIRYFAAADAQAIRADAVRSRLDAELNRRAPSGFRRDGSADFYAWRFGTMAAYQAGGTTWDRWKALTLEIRKAQCTDGCAQGSWEPVDAWGGEGGRVYATAVLCRALMTHALISRRTDESPKDR